MWELYLGQALGILATVISFIAYQANTNRGVLVLNTLATLSTCLSYLFLGANAGFLLNIVCIVRNITFYFERAGTWYSTLTAGALATVMAVLGALSWQGPVSLLIIVALAANTLFFSFGKPQLLRYSILVTSSLILIYNIFVFSIGGIVNEGVAITSSAIGILRFHKSTEAAPEAERSVP